MDEPLAAGELRDFALAALEAVLGTPGLGMAEDPEFHLQARWHCRFTTKAAAAGLLNGQHRYLAQPILKDSLPCGLFLFEFRGEPRAVLLDGTRRLRLVKLHPWASAQHFSSNTYLTGHLAVPHRLLLVDDLLLCAGRPTHEMSLHERLCAVQLLEHEWRRAAAAAAVADRHPEGTLELSAMPTRFFPQAATALLEMRAVAGSPVVGFRLRPSAELPFGETPAATVGVDTLFRRLPHAYQVWHEAAGGPVVEVEVRVHTSTRQLQFWSQTALVGVWPDVAAAADAKEEEWLRRGAEASSARKARFIVSARLHSAEPLRLAPIRARPDLRVANSEGRLTEARTSLRERLTTEWLLRDLFLRTVHSGAGADLTEEQAAWLQRELPDWCSRPPTLRTRLRPSAWHLEPYAHGIPALDSPATVLERLPG